MQSQLPAAELCSYPQLGNEAQRPTIWQRLGRILGQEGTRCRCRLLGSAHERP